MVIFVAAAKAGENADRLLERRFVHDDLLQAAGEHVAIGSFYDDPVRASPENKHGYMGYRGSGFQHLVNVRRHQSGPWTADYAHEKDPNAQLRLRVLPQPGQETMLAEARVSPVKFPQILHYLIARREAKDGVLESKLVEQALLERIATRLSHFPGYARILRVHAGRTLWKVQDGLMTATLKLRREQLLERYAGEIESMYAGH